MRHIAYSFVYNFSRSSRKRAFFLEAADLRAQPLRQLGFALFLIPAHVKVVESLATVAKRNLMAWNCVLTLRQWNKPHQPARAARMRTLGVIEIQARRRIAQQNARMAEDNANSLVISVLQKQKL